MSYKNILFCVVWGAFLIAAPIQAEAQDLGQGYSCANGLIIKKGKEVSLKKAKAAVQSKISKLGSSKKDKAKKNVLNALKKALTECGGGSTGGGGGYTQLLSTTLTAKYRNPDGDERTTVYLVFYAASGPAAIPTAWCVQVTGAFGDGTQFTPTHPSLGPAVFMYKDVCENVPFTVTECVNPVPAGGYGFFPKAVEVSPGGSVEEAQAKAQQLFGTLQVSAKPFTGTGSQRCQ